MRRKIVGTIAMLLAFSICLNGCGNSGTKISSDTVKWFNTSYAVLIVANEGDINEIGGESKQLASTKIKVRMSLEQAWSITDRASADKTLADLLDGGHRVSFNEEMKDLADAGFFELSEAEFEQMFDQQQGQEGVDLLRNAVSAYNEFGENAIAAWDYCRAMQLLGYFYLADFYTEQETLDKSLEVAKTLQGMYKSWDEMMKSYLCGYQYWQEDDSKDLESATAKRTEVYQQLKLSENNPYTLDWNTELVKTW